MMITCEDMGSGLVCFDGGPAGSIVVRAGEVRGVVVREGELVVLLADGSWAAPLPDDPDEGRATLRAAVSVWRSAMAFDDYRTATRIITIGGVKGELLAEAARLIGGAVAEQLAAQAEAELTAEAQAEAEKAGAQAEADDVALAEKAGLRVFVVRAEAEQLATAYRALVNSGLTFSSSKPEPGVMRVNAARATADDVRDLLGWRGLEVEELT